MNKFFFTLLILALFLFEVKPDHIPREILQKINNLINFFIENDLWIELLKIIRLYGEDYAINWCTKYSDYYICEALIEDYLDDEDDDDD